MLGSHETVLEEERLAGYNTARHREGEPCTIGVGQIRTRSPIVQELINYPRAIWGLGQKTTANTADFFLIFF